MEHAWLDSLSEDWPSQNSEGSPSACLPPLKNESPKSTTRPTSATRLPRPILGTRRSTHGARDTSVQILSERSANDINIRASLRTPSKLSQEGKNSVRSQPVATGTTRTVSASTDGSVIHNTVNQRSPSGIHSRKQDTPEWKRRLVYGEVAYGEQRDLFCSAATGLENMFKPPQQSQQQQHDASAQKDTPFQSSPPRNQSKFYFTPAPNGSNNFNDDDDEEYDQDEDEDEEPHPSDFSPSPSPRRRPAQMQYRMTDADDTMDQTPSSPCSAGENNSNKNNSGSQNYEDEENESDGSVVHNVANPSQARQTSRANMRKVSTQSDARHEDFSTIYLTKRDSGDGKVDFTPAVKPDQLRKKLECLRLNQLIFNSKAPTVGDFDVSEGGSRMLDSTPMYERNGGFINTQRGGRSSEGSFMHKPLSSTLATDTSEMLPDDSLQASTPKHFPSIRIDGPSSDEATPPLPRAPNPSPQKTTGTTGSPLKLFGPYDTFTNQTLLRRISQYEEPSSQSPSRVSIESPNVNAPDHSKASQTAVVSGSINRFGDGDLEGFEFSDEMSKLSMGHSGVEGDKENMSPQWRNSPPVGSLRLSRPDLTLADGEELAVQKMRRGSQSTHRASGSSHKDIMATPQRRDTGSVAKRRWSSPTKDPTPKRRRTLHKSDIAFGREYDDDGDNAVQKSHQSMQSSIMGKKRGTGTQNTPKLPSLRQTSSSTSLRRVSGSSTSQKQRRLLHRKSFDTGSSTPPSLSIPANKTNQSMYDSSTNGFRKPSIRTQDFLNAAGKIMAMIRNQVQPNGGLDSLEESVSEGGDSPSQLEYSFQESTKEPFSRPPSREGAEPISRHPKIQIDPELADRLRRYQEMSDMGDIVSSSMHSIRLAKDAALFAQEIERQVQASTRSGLSAPLGEDEVFSDPPNIRITANPKLQAQTVLADGQVVADFPSHTSGHSTIPTASSRCSESRKTIAPQSVSHLIPDQVGSMYLDREKNIWLRSKSGGGGGGEAGTPKAKVNTSTESRPQQQRSSPRDDSEDDPFASIPDLTVDVTTEMKNLNLVSAKKPLATLVDNVDGRPSPSPSLTPRSASQRGYVTLSPDAILSHGSFARARDELNKLGSRTPSKSTSEQDADFDETVDYDIKGQTPRGDQQGQIIEDTPRRRRNLTISFSSPIASIINEVVAEDLDDLEDDAEPEAEGLYDVRYRSLSKPMRNQILSSALKNTTPKSDRRRASFVQQQFIPRPVSRISEREDEDEEPVSCLVATTTTKNN